MDIPKLTRAQRRRLRKLADPLRCITQGDLNFFAAFPHRRYRVREADCAEIEHAELTGGGVTLSPGNRHCRAIRYLTPHACLSLPVGGPADTDPELFDEEMARAIFKYAAPLEPFVYMQGGYTYAEILAIFEVLK
jgi:hypothetical protein